MVRPTSPTMPTYTDLVNFRDYDDPRYDWRSPEMRDLNKKASEDAKKFNQGVVKGGTVSAVGTAAPKILSNPGALVANPLFAAGAIAYSFKDRLKSGKAGDQKMRDEVRGRLMDSGLVAKDWKLRFSDGSEFDIGKDGKDKILNADGKSERLYRQKDPTNPLTGFGSNAVAPIAAMMTGNDPRMQAEFEAYLTSAVTQGAQNQEQAAQRIRELYGEWGLTQDKAKANLDALQKQGLLKDGQYEFALQQINTFAPKEDPRSPVDAFLPRGTYFNTVLRNALDKFNSRTGMGYPYSPMGSLDANTTVYGNQAPVDYGSAQVPIQGGQASGAPAQAIQEPAPPRLDQLL
jgi:hypothetical protein